MVKYVVENNVYINFFRNIILFVELVLEDCFKVSFIY